MRKANVNNKLETFTVIQRRLLVTYKSRYLKLSKDREKSIARYIRDILASIFFFFFFFKNIQNTTLSSFSKWLSLNMRSLLEQLFSKAFKYFSLRLTHVEIVLNGTPDFKEASLLDSPFSIFLIALYFAFSVFTESFLFTILTLLKANDWRMIIFTQRVRAIKK